MSPIGRFHLTLAPFGLEAEEVETLVDALGVILASRLDAAIAVHPARLDLTAAYDPARRQYHARRLLDQLADLPGDVVLGLTGLDLYLPVFTFVFGEAKLGGRSGVVSIHRLAPERYGLPPDCDRLLGRLARESVHEIGHCLGLVHCPDTACAMAASHDPEMVDAKSDAYCADCRRRVAVPRPGGALDLARPVRT